MSNFRNALLIFAVGFVLAGCDIDDGTDTKLEIVKPIEQSRIQVERIGVFWDDLAYNQKRGIYIITDRITGKEFFGISGIGTGELGSHVDDDETVRDER